MHEQYKVEPIILETKGAAIAPSDGSLWGNRKFIYDLTEPKDSPLVSIYVLAYNRLSKTKYCVECILEYTASFNFELILVDNGSDDGTYEYFQSVPWKSKVIIKVTENKGSVYPWGFVKRIYKGKYLVTVANDVYVTKNWLSNLIYCMESDPRIGFVMPVSSNVSNLQQEDLNFQTMEEMQKAAAQFNQSDPFKWEERMRLITIIGIFKKEIIDLVGTADCGFTHDFGEDDYCARIRRAGYRLILCRDTFIHHDHDFRHGEDKDIQKYQKSLNEGKRFFQEKYHGLDAWDDILNFEQPLISQLNPKHFKSRIVHSLCVDVRCGTPVLEIRNQFKRNHANHELISHAFTTEAKYYTELQQQAEYAACDRIDFIQDHYLNHSMNIILLGNPVNTYPKPVSLIQKLLGFLTPQGVLMFKVRNINDYLGLMQSLCIGYNSDPDFPTPLPLDELNACLEMMGVSEAKILSEPWQLNQQSIEELQNLIKKIKLQNSSAAYNNLITKNFHYFIIK